LLFYTYIVYDLKLDEPLDASMNENLDDSEFMDEPSFKAMDEDEAFPDHCLNCNLLQQKLDAAYFRIAELEPAKPMNTSLNASYERHASVTVSNQARV
jgi:hypothetical protein